ncbi:hypothetical protein F2P79_007324 [Pimephales promelas]|nr:hypothetical protein F2P79_007324 [Pimephales promelas]
MEVQPITLVYCFKLREKYFKITAFPKQREQFEAARSAYYNNTKSTRLRTTFTVKQTFAFISFTRGLRTGIRLRNTPEMARLRCSDKEVTPGVEYCQIQMHQ